MELETAIKKMFTPHGRLRARFKEAWIEDLESGNFKQGQQSLQAFTKQKKEPRFCCLGVAACRLDPTGWTVTEELISGRTTMAWHGNSGSLPIDLIHGGLMSAYFKPGGYERADNFLGICIGLNDGTGEGTKGVKASFKTIAKKLRDGSIEAEVERRFAENHS